MAFLTTRKKVPKYFSGTTIFAFSNAPAAFGLPKRFDLYLKDDEPVSALSVTLSGFPSSVIFCSSLLNCHKLPEEFA